MAPLRGDSSWYGLLRPLDPAETAKSISRDVAAIVAAMRSPATPAALAQYANETQPPSARDFLRLVADGVLEIETHAGFRSGPQALRDVGVSVSVEAIDRTSLSVAALAYGARLGAIDRLWLSDRLYRFNRMPIGLSARQQLVRRGVDGAIGLDATIAAGITTRWQRSGNGSTWIRFSRRGAPRRDLTHKLYLSPALDRLADVFPIALRELERAGVPAFKIAGTLAELPRPDRFVAYLPDRATVLELAAGLSTALAGVPAQGVPFTALAEPTGLVSWGMDPPQDRSRLAWQGPSWRRWLTDILAGALISGRDMGGEEAVRGALARVSLEGVDTRDWVPAEGIWEN